MVFKYLNGLVPEYLTSKFVTRNESNYALRDSVNKLVVPFPRLDYKKNSFSYSGATLWNSLPCNIREFGSLNQFKCFLYHNFQTQGIHGNQVYSQNIVVAFSLRSRCQLLYTSVPNFTFRVTHLTPDSCRLPQPTRSLILISSGTLRISC